MNKFQAGFVVAISAGTVGLACSSANSSRGDAGNGPMTSSGNCDLGPGRYCWSTYSDPGGTVAWVTPPTLTAAHVSGVAPSDGEVGMTAELNPGNSVNLAKYDLLWFNANIPSGTMATVHFANADGSGCQWTLNGVGSARYSVDLTSAHFCWQTNCGVPRTNVVQLGFEPYGWGGNIDMTVTDLGFSALSFDMNPNTTGSGSTRLPNGLCWSLFSWGTGASSVWATPPDETQALVPPNREHS